MRPCSHEALFKFKRGTMAMDSQFAFHIFVNVSFFVRCHVLCVMNFLRDQIKFISYQSLTWRQPKIELLAHEHVGQKTYSMHFCTCKSLELSFLFSYFPYRPPPEPGGRGSQPLVYIYGDSLTKKLQKDLRSFNTGLDSSFKYVVNAHGGFTLERLQNLIHLEQSNLNVEYVVLHIGTNSLSHCGNMCRFVRQYKELIATTRVRFPAAAILVSELFVRDAIDVRPYNFELNSLCRSEGVYFIRSSVSELDLSFDELHLDDIGYRRFAEDIHKNLLRVSGQLQWQHVPSSMVPPLSSQIKPKKKKRNLKHQASSTCKPALHKLSIILHFVSY